MVERRSRIPDGTFVREGYLTPLARRPKLLIFCLGLIVCDVFNAQEDSPIATPSKKSLLEVGSREPSWLAAHRLAFESNAMPRTQCQHPSARELQHLILADVGDPDIDGVTNALESTHLPSMGKSISRSIGRCQFAD